MADPAQRGGFVPLQRRFEFSVPGAVAVVPHDGFVGVRAGRVLDAILAGCRGLAHGIVRILQRQDLFTLNLMQTQFRRFRTSGWQGLLLITAQVGIPIAGLPVVEFDRLETVDERDHFFGQHFAKFTHGNRTADGKHAQLQQRVHGADQMLDRLGGLPLRPLDDAFKHFVEKLIRHVRHHHFAQHGYERRDDERRGLEDGRGNVDEGIPQRPARFAVDAGRRDGNDPRIIEDLVHFALVQVLPEVRTDQRRIQLQVGPFERFVAPDRF